MRHRSSSRRVPLVQSAAKCSNLDWTGEAGDRIDSAPKRIANPVPILLVAVHYHQRPLPIRTLHSIRSYHFAASAILVIGLSRIDLMLSAARLHGLRVFEKEIDWTRRWHDFYTKVIFRARPGGVGEFTGQVEFKFGDGNPKNAPRRDLPQMNVNPKKAKVSGLPSPFRCRRAAA